jgi:hypothetical protein
MSERNSRKIFYVLMLIDAALLSGGVLLMVLHRSDQTVAVIGQSIMIVGLVLLVVTCAAYVIGRKIGILAPRSKTSATDSADQTPLEQLQAQCEKVGETDPADIRKIASLLQQMSLDYYRDVRMQAQQSFYSALGAAVVGSLFFLFAAWYVMQRPDKVSYSYISLIAGALVEVISAINFYLYGKVANQFSGFHICLERTNRFLLANTLCENLADPYKDSARQELIGIIANAPMLTLDVMNAAARQSESGQTNSAIES